MADSILQGIIHMQKAQRAEIIKAQEENIINSMVAGANGFNHVSSKVNLPGPEIRVNIPSVVSANVSDNVIVNAAVNGANSFNGANRSGPLPGASDQDILIESALAGAASFRK